MRQDAEQVRWRCRGLGAGEGVRYRSRRSENPTRRGFSPRSSCRSRPRQWRVSVTARPETGWRILPR